MDLMPRAALILVAGLLVVLAVEHLSSGGSILLTLASFAGALLVLLATGPGIGKQIDQPSTPTALRVHRIYMLIVSLIMTSIGLGVAWNIGATAQPAALELLGLVAAGVAVAVAALMLIAWTVQVRRASDDRSP